MEALSPPSIPFRNEDRMVTRRECHLRSIVFIPCILRFLFFFLDDKRRVFKICSNTLQNLNDAISHFFGQVFVLFKSITGSKYFYYYLFQSGGSHLDCCVRSVGKQSAWSFPWVPAPLLTLSTAPNFRWFSAPSFSPTERLVVVFPPLRFIACISRLVFALEDSRRGKVMIAGEA